MEITDGVCVCVSLYNLWGVTPKSFTQQHKKIVKAAIRNFFLVKKDPKSVFEQVHNQPVFKTISLI